MPVNSFLSRVLPANNPDLSVKEALSHYNQFARFIATISNAPQRLLSGWHSASRNSLPRIKSNASVLESAEHQQLLAALYRPSSFPPPESIKSDLAEEVADFLELSGLANIGIPAPINRVVLTQLKVILGDAGLYHGPQDDGWLLNYLARHYRGSYFSLSMIMTAICPLSQRLDTLIPGLGTALYHILSCQPLHILFPVSLPIETESSELIYKESNPIKMLFLPSMQPCFGPTLTNNLYWLAPNTTTLFQSPYIDALGETCPAFKEIPANKQVNPNNVTSVFGELYSDIGRLFYAVVTTQQPVAINTQEDKSGLYLLQKERLQKERATTNVSGKALRIKSSSVTASPPLLNKISAVNDMPAPMDNVITTVRRALFWLDKQSRFLPVAEAGSITPFIQPSWSASLRRPREIAESLVPKPLTLDKFFPDDYHYLDITRRLRVWAGPNGARLTVIQLVEKLLTEETRRYLMEDVDGAMPEAVANYYRCARLEVNQQPKSWKINGFLKYLLHLLNIERIFQTEDYNALYTLLGRLHPLDEKFVTALAAFIKPNSGSKGIDEILRGVISHLAFPLHLLAKDNYTSHEMRGWKILFGLCLEHYFPAHLRGKPMDTANDFINLLRDGLKNGEDKTKIISLLTQPPLSFVFELMTLDLLHEKLVDNQSGRIVSLLSTFRQEEVLRYRILSLGSRAVVEKLYTLERQTDARTQRESVDTIRSSLVSSTAITLKFILSNWFYQSSLDRLKVSVLRINFSCWLKPTSKQLTGRSLFQGGAFRFEFNQSVFFFFIDESGECSYLAAGETQAKNELLSNKKFYREGNINEAFFTTTGHELSDIDGGLNLSFEEVNKLGPLGLGDNNAFLQQIATAFVDNVAFNTPRKNKLLGSTFGTRMKSWYSGLSLEVFVPLWGCYDSLKDKQQDEIEKLIVCSIEAPTASLLVQKGSELIKALKSSFYINPQDLFTDLSESASSLRTLFISPRHGIYVASEASTEILSSVISPATHSLGVNPASAMITQIHGSSVESFSSLGSSGRSSCYFASGPNTPLEPMTMHALPINTIQTSASIGNIHSSTTSLRGQINMNSMLSLPSENMMPREDDIMRFLGVLNDRVRERRWQLLQLSLTILAETTDALLGNIPSLLLKKAGLKLVLQAILLIATIETFKAYILAAYNEYKHGGYQDTQIEDFKLKFIDGNRLSLEFTGTGGASKIHHETRIDYETAQALTQQGLVKLPLDDLIKATDFEGEEQAAWAFNRAIMDRLLMGLAIPASLSMSSKHRRLPGSTYPFTGAQQPGNISSLPFAYLKLLTLDAENFVALLSWLHQVDYLLEEVEVISWQIPQYHTAQPAHFTRVIDALKLPQYKQSHIIYPDFIANDIQQALERYRHASATDYINETNRLHRLQYLPLTPARYLNFSFSQLQQYLLDHYRLDISRLEVTRVDWQPFTITTLSLKQAVLQRNVARPRYNDKPQFIFAAEIPAKGVIFLYQYLNATPEQLLSERATRLTHNRRAGLGIGQLKSLYTPYFSLPAALFLSSRIVRYGFDRAELMAQRFEFCQSGQCREVGLLEVLHDKLSVQLESSSLLRGNDMLRREFEDYLSARDSDREDERKNRALYRAMYVENTRSRLNATDFIVRISLKYSAAINIKLDVLVDVIDSYTSRTMTLQQALEDQTDNTLVAFPDDWPQEVCIEFDVYRQTRYGNLLPPDFSL